MTMVYDIPERMTNADSNLLQVFFSFRGRGIE